jgi:Rps23 Pro-64 3,4-dihydroxylase Tpa1-like proline 4-hydroxylase
MSESNTDNKIVKININYLENLENFDENKIFGDWINNIDKLNYDYQNAKPFSNIIIDNFLNDDYAEILYNQFPNINEDWYKYWNPLEIKYAYNNINNLPDEIKDLFYYLSTKKIINKFSEISEITNLEYDIYLHGAGLHAHPRHGRLNLHLDYEKHPITGKERRINIILYLSKDWKEEWNGHTELWNKDVSKCIVKSSIKFNTAIIFQTNNISYHGLPEKIMCPKNILRKSLAYYYISPLESKKDNSKLGSIDGYRLKASFVKRPNDVNSEQINKLYNIRPNRLITQKDINEIWPDWNEITD